MTARAQSEKTWVDYEGLKFYLSRTTVASPIVDVACDNTDSIFTQGTNTSSHFPKLILFLFLFLPYWILRRVTAARSQTPLPVPRSPFPVLRSLFPVLRSLFSVSRFPFPVPRSPFLVFRFPFPVPSFSNIRSRAFIRDFKISYGEVLLRLLWPWGTRLTTVFYSPNSND